MSFTRKFSICIIERVHHTLKLNIQLKLYSLENYRGAQMGEITNKPHTKNTQFSLLIR